MPCPLFVPVSLRGGQYEGRCFGNAELVISAEVLRTCCNPGYARGRCRIAEGVEADAALLMIVKESVGTVEVAWALERDHHPLAVGTANADAPETGRADLDAQIRGYATATRRA